MIFAFIKIFKEEQHRKEFLNGKLYMNRLGYFKSYKDECANNISDKYEATSLWWQPNCIKSISINELTIPTKDIAGPLLRLPLKKGKQGCFVWR